MAGPEAGGGAGKALVVAGALAGVAGAPAVWPVAVAVVRGGDGMKSGPFWPQAARLVTPRMPMAAIAKPQRPLRQETREEPPKIRSVI